MYDVLFKQARLGDQASLSTSDYAAQDFESLPVGPLTVPFTYSVQSGNVFLSFAFITPTPVSINLFDYQDFEALPAGVITVIPATNLAAVSVLTPVQPTAAFFLTGTITPGLAQYVSDDFESYASGNVTILNNPFQGGGDVIVKVATIFAHFPGT